jgi:endonuclease YncB( thermonuclease family)
MFPSKKNDDLFANPVITSLIFFILLAFTVWVMIFSIFVARPVSEPNYSDQTEVVFGSKSEDAPFRLTSPARIVSIHDGDTVTVELKLQTSIRLLDCWAPEITGQEKQNGLKSKQFLETCLKSGDEVVVDIPFQENFSKSLTLSRVLARIYKDVDNDGTKDDLSKVMVKNGFAKEKK